MANSEKRVLGTIKVKEDVGSMFPIHHRATLHLWSDGSVTWSLLEHESAATYKYEEVAKPEDASSE